MLQVLPILAYVVAMVFILAVASNRQMAGPRMWVLASILAVAFTGFSVVTFLQDGLLPFWTNHTTNLAGNQVWLDLLIAVSIALFLIAPRARAVGMSMWPWSLAVMATASLALLPMLARLIWLEHRNQRRP